MEPNKDNLRKWVEALRSGIYEQGKSALYHKNTFCCLGVACVVAFNEGAIATIPWEREGEDNENASLPHDVRDWLGLERVNPTLVDDFSGDCTFCKGPCTEGTVSASRANDSLGWSFDKIADAIDATYGLKESEPVATG